MGLADEFAAAAEDHRKKALEEEKTRQRSYDEGSRQAKPFISFLAEAAEVLRTNGVSYRKAWHGVPGWRGGAEKFYPAGWNLPHPHDEMFLSPDGVLLLPVRETLPVGGGSSRYVVHWEPAELPALWNKHNPYCHTTLPGYYCCDKVYDSICINIESAIRKYVLAQATELSL